jgi:hypothetical protein
MKEREFGEAYYNALGAIKDNIATELFTECSKLGLKNEQIQRVIFVAQGTVDGVGGRAFDSLIKSVG